MDTFQYLCTNGNGSLSEIQEFVSKNRHLRDEALRFACSTKRFDVIQMLVKKGASLKIGCMIEACVVGNVDIVKFIIEHNVDVNEMEYGIRPLLAAMIGDRTHIVKILCEAGANIPYSCIAKSVECNVDILRYFLTNEMPKNKQFFDSYLLGRLLVGACVAGRLDNVDFLVSNGADIHIENSHPLQISAARGHLDIVEYLVRAGADVHASNEMAVKSSCWERKYEVVKYLISVGADRSVITPKAERYLQICERTCNRAQKKIYFWWIPICYETQRDCGKRMRDKNWERTQALLMEQ